MNRRYIQVAIALTFWFSLRTAHTQTDPNATGTIGIALAAIYDETSPTHRGPWIVTWVAQGFPAGRAGVRLGDVLIAVGVRPLSGLSNEELSGLLSGPPGSTMDLLLLRQSATKLISLRDIQRVSMSSATHPPEREAEADAEALKQFLDVEGHGLAAATSATVPSDGSHEVKGNNGEQHAPRPSGFPDTDFSYIIFPSSVPDAGSFVGTWSRESATAVSYDKVEVEIRQNGTFTRTQTVRTPSFTSSPTGGYMGSGPSLVTSKEGTWTVVQGGLVLSTGDDMRGLTKAR